jgi:hypothetical protein
MRTNEASGKTWEAQEYRNEWKMKVLSGELQAMKTSALSRKETMWVQEAK